LTRVGELLLEENPDTDVLYRSEPCVSYPDSYRTRAPIKTHLGGGGGVTVRSPMNTDVSIGELHLGSSTIGQAESLCIENVETDYAILTDPTAAVSPWCVLSTQQFYVLVTIFKAPSHSSVR
jgi:hypothetical protein